MSKLMTVLGIILLAVGVALALVGLVNPAQILVYGLSIESALNLIVGGILSIGLGGVIQALGGHAVHVVEAAAEPTPAAIEAEPAEEAAAEDARAPVVEEEKKPSGGFKFPGFGRKLGASTVTAAVASAAEAAQDTASAAAETVADAGAHAAEATSSSVQDTISALEQARSDIENALGGVKAPAAPAHIADEEPVEDPEPVADDAAEDELFVVEDRIIRGRPARLLSDGTVEAETEEGWMRFENLEHLDEYLDAVDAG